MATYTRTYTITEGLKALGGKRRKFPLSGNGVSVTGETTVPIKKITGIKVTRFHAVNLSTTWYLKAAFSKTTDDDGEFSFISSDKQSINSTSFIEKPAYFKEGERTLLYTNGSSITVSTLPTPDDWDDIAEKGALVIFANRLGHEYLGSSIETLPSDYYLLTLVDSSHPIVITVTYEGEEQQDFTIESLSAMRTDNNGGFSVSLKINYSNDYIFTSNDTMTAYLSKNSNLNNPEKTYDLTEKWGDYKTGSSFTWSGASESNTIYYIGVTATVNGKTVTLTTTLPQLSSTGGGATNFHLSGSGKGVGIGGLSKGTVAEPSFDCYYPSIFYNDVTINGNISLGGESAIPKVLYGFANSSLNVSSQDGTGIATIEFKEPFESAPIVTATLYRPKIENGADGAARQPSYVITEITNSSFTLHCRQVTLANTTYGVYWIAIGI